MGKQQLVQASAPGTAPSCWRLQTTLASRPPDFISFLKRDTQVFLIFRLGWGWKRMQGVLPGEACAATCIQPAGCRANLCLPFPPSTPWHLTKLNREKFSGESELQLRFTETFKPSSEAYLKQKVPWNWIQTNYYYDHIVKKNLVISKLNLWPTDVLCFCVCLLRLKSEAAHVLGNRRATSHVRVQTTDPPPETVIFCKNISMFSRSGAEISLLLSSTHPSYLSNSTKPDSLWLQPCFIQCEIASSGATQTGMSRTTLQLGDQCERWESRRQNPCSKMAREVLCGKVGWKRACRLWQ